MQNYLKHSLESLREEGAALSWLEESRFEFYPTLFQAINQLMAGKTMIVITDRDRKWFEEYILNSINKAINERPMIPVVSIEAIYPAYDSIVGGEMIAMLEDMLELSYGSGYFFFYIGKGSDIRSDIAKRDDKSLLWIFDEESSNYMTLKTSDALLDIKLLQLYREFNKTFNSLLFGEVDADE